MQTLEQARAIIDRARVRSFSPPDFKDLTEVEELEQMEIEALIKKWRERVEMLESGEIHDAYEAIEREITTLTDCANELEAALKKAKES